MGIRERLDGQGERGRDVVGAVREGMRREVRVRRGGVQNVLVWVVLGVVQWGRG